MNNTKLDQFSLYQKIHFIGIGGIGISALARILKLQGHQISGSDQKQNNITNDLSKEGILITHGHSSDNIPANCDLIIYTTAIPQTNPELQYAQYHDIKCLTYPQAVGLLTKDYQTISICGTHGKTTTTSMIGLALIANQQDPTIIVGSLLPELGNKNERIGKSKLFILESCEYQEAFLNYHPSIIVLNNIEAEHLDYFKNEENYLFAFQKFINQLQPNGLIIANGDDSNIQKIIKQNPTKKFITFGQKSQNDYVIINKQILHQNEIIATLNLNLPGLHNIYNATATLILSEHLKLNREITINTVNRFQGASRRFEIKGQVGKTTIIDDYGHTPTEIQATLQGLREKLGENAKILCVFQPHQYSRTYEFLDQFANSFHSVNQVYIPNIYRTRDSEEDVQRVSPEDLVAKINQNQSEKAKHTISLDYSFEIIKENFQDYDAIITMGAGDITNLSTQLLNLR